MIPRFSFLAPAVPTRKAWALPMLLGTGLCSLLLSACTVTRVTPPPVATAPLQFKEQRVWQEPEKVISTTISDSWWTIFNDPILNHLEDQVMVTNQTLKASLAQVDYARAQLQAAQATLAPQVTSDFQVTRSQSPRLGNASKGGRLIRRPESLLTLETQGQWELDIWGRLHLGVERAADLYQASADDLAAVKLITQATLAQTYFALRTTEAKQNLLHRSIEAFKRSVQITQARYDAGIISQSDVLQAQTRLKSAESQLLETDSERIRLENALAVLVGVAPSDFKLAASGELPDPPLVPEFVPAVLLERRPDIAAAQQRVAAAYAQIGVANAAFLPSLALFGNVGYRNTSFSQFLSPPHLFWLVGNTLAETLMDGGARQAVSNQAQAKALQAYADYRQTVLTALEEVENNLGLAYNLARASDTQYAAWQYAKRNVKITQDQYKVGMIDYLTVVLTQTAALDAERDWLDIKGRRLAAINQLFKNIAGHWESVVPNKMLPKAGQLPSNAAQ